MILTGANQSTWSKKKVPVKHCPPQIPHGLAWNGTWASVVTACLCHGIAKD